MDVGKGGHLLGAAGQRGGREIDGIVSDRRAARERFQNPPRFGAGAAAQFGDGNGHFEAFGQLGGQTPDEPRIGARQAVLG